MSFKIFTYNFITYNFLSIPENKTTTHSLLIGRNYDYPPPFDQLAKYLTVTVLQEDNSSSSHTVPTAFISIVGEIYCPTCVNAKGLFMELNNGMASGGYDVNQNTESLLIKLLEVIQHSINMQQIQQQLNTAQTDYSLIINTSDKHTVRSYEFSSALGMKSFAPKINKVFASTNFYLDKNWQNIPKPRDDSTSLGITRRNNLLDLSNDASEMDVAKLKQLMDKTIKEGGAVSNLTIYQIIFDPNNLSLYIKINNEGNRWDKIPLKKLYS